MEALIEAHATELKLPTVKRRFRGLAEEATREQQTPTAYLAALLEAETAERAERREVKRTRRPCWQAQIARAVARCVLPLPLSPMRITDSRSVI